MPSGLLIAVEIRFTGSRRSFSRLQWQTRQDKMGTGYLRNKTLVAEPFDFFREKPVQSYRSSFDFAKRYFS
jgi:hypothetical protein